MPKPSIHQIRRLSTKLVAAGFSPADVTAVVKYVDKTFVCDSCCDRIERRYMKKCRGMKLCPECRESARDYFGR